MTTDNFKSIENILAEIIIGFKSISIKKSNLDILGRFTKKDCIALNTSTLELFTMEYLNLPIGIINPLLLDDLGYFTISNIFKRAMINKIFDGSITAKTVDNYVSDYKRFLMYNEFDKLNIMEVDFTCLNTHVDDLFSRETIKLSAYNNLINILNLIFDYAIENGIIEEKFTLPTYYEYAEACNYSIV